MAATAIDELLIAIGFEVDDEQAKDASSMMGSLSDEALKLGGILGAGLGLNELTFGFAGANDELAKFARLNGVSIEEVDRLAYALQREGGTAQDAFGEMKNLNDMLGKLQAGDVSWASELSRFGFDPKTLMQAENLSQLVNIIAEGYQDLDAQQRMQVGNILGLGDAARGLMSLGPEGLAGYSAQLNRRGTINKEETDAAEAFNDAVLNLQMTVRGFSKELSGKLLVDLTRSINTLDEAVLSKKGVVMDFFTEYQDEIGDAFLGAAVIGAAGLGSKLFKVLGGIPNIILSYVVGNLANMWDWDAKDVQKEFGVQLPDWIFKPISELSSEDVINTLRPEEAAPPRAKIPGQSFGRGSSDGRPVATPQQISAQTSAQTAQFWPAPQQPIKIDQRLQFTITESTDARDTAQKISVDVKSATETAIKKLGNNVQ